ncbi:DMT family transporter [Sedimentitalea todarodis]|uniref:DMT family transporter n=1 Tax=Sedimentitalea todarodis TaxID=1631240 RepID=A0ABU3VJJ1_9RHOB|nr:DMT family transporter [Sedimentitalea todarodis]MDU9006320.1 DMT family transporter [Sedimentitalea todarodis]
MDNGQTTRPLVGILWMLVTGLCFVAVTAIVKYLGPRIPPEEQAFLRYFLGLVFLIPMLPALLSTRLNGKLVLQFGARGALHAVGVMLWFYAMTRIPLAEVTAINYLAPVYVTLGAALFLGETLAMRRIAAVITALIGAIIILRPGFREVESGHMAMLLAAVLFGGSYLLAKVTVAKVPAAVVVGMLSIVVTMALAPFAYAVWVTPTWAEIGILFGVACFATAGHYTMTLAFAAAPVAVTQPVTFLQLVWATALGALAFGEPVDFWVVLGGAIVLASVTFITWRETMLNRRQITPATPATKV